MGIGRFIDECSGSVTYANLIWMIAFIAIGGLAVDGANAFRMRAIMQATADAAALAAAAELPDKTAARAAARRYVELNMPAAEFGELMQSADLVLGTWDEATDSIIGNAQTNAVRVSLARSDDRDNALSTFLMRVIGRTSFAIDTSAVALAKGPECAGVLSNASVKLKHRPFVGDDVCLYGRSGIKIGKDLVAEAGARIGTTDLDNLKLGKGSEIPEGVLFEASYTADRATAIAEIINSWVGPYGDGSGGNPPNGWQVVGPLDELPETLLPNKIYYVDQSLTITRKHEVNDVIIAVSGDVRWGHGGRYSNTLSCENGEAIGLYATGDIKMGHEPVGRGIDMVAGGRVQIGHDIGSSEMLIEAEGEIDFGHDPVYTNTCRPLFVAGGSARLRR